MKTTLAISLITSALLLAGCAQESTVKNKENKQAVEKEQQIVLIPVEKWEEEDAELLIQPELATADQRKRIKPAIKYASMPAQGLMAKQEGIAGRQSMPHPAPLMREITRGTNQNNEKYSHQDKNSTLIVSEQPVSTFSIDVDTAAYANVRRVLNQGLIPQHDSIRVEEMINYFNYDYPKLNQKSEVPFSVISEVGPSPYNTDKHLLHIGIQGKAIPKAERPASNLVFLLDVSGSMNSANKLGLLKNALKMLTNQLTEQDSVSIVVYAGAAGTVLKPTKGDNKQAIIDALAQLSAGGSTNGGAGIDAAYRLAKQAFIKDGINRVILATDGDFNVGTVNNQALENLIEEKRESGIELSILGFGMGNYNDALMQQLAQNGNGNAYYIDNLNEARKVLVEELSSTLFTIAKDVKIQVEFNPNLVSEYRLIGYETRALKREDFNNDKVDAGEIGAGHSVTALYELSFVDGNNKANDPLRYQAVPPINLNTKSSSTNVNSELAFLRLRYKTPNTDSSKLIEVPITQSSVITDINQTSGNFQFSAAVAGFAQLLRGGENLSTMKQNDIIALAKQSKGKDEHGYRAEFINLVKLAQALLPITNTKPQKLANNK